MARDHFPTWFHSAVQINEPKSSVAPCLAEPGFPYCSRPSFQKRPLRRPSIWLTAEQAVKAAWEQVWLYPCNGQILYSLWVILSDANLSDVMKKSIQK